MTEQMISKNIFLLDRDRISLAGRDNMRVLNKFVRRETGGAVPEDFEMHEGVFTIYTLQINILGRNFPGDKVVLRVVQANSSTVLY